MLLDENIFYNTFYNNFYNIWRNILSFLKLFYFYDKELTRKIGITY